jgi:hypothetical protein
MTFYVRTFMENNISCGMYKKKKNIMCVVMLEHQNLSYTRHRKYFFPKNLCINIKCLDIHAKVYFKIYFHTTSPYASMS